MYTCTNPQTQVANHASINWSSQDKTSKTAPKGLAENLVDIPAAVPTPEVVGSQDYGFNDGIWWFNPIYVNI